MLLTLPSRLMLTQTRLIAILLTQHCNQTSMRMLLLTLLNLLLVMLLTLPSRLMLTQMRLTAILLMPRCSLTSIRMNQIATPLMLRCSLTLTRTKLLATLLTLRCRATSTRCLLLWLPLTVSSSPTSKLRLLPASLLTETCRRKLTETTLTSLLCRTASSRRSWPAALVTR